MPPENRVGRDDRGDLMKSATAQPVSVHCQPTPFLIGQTDPAAQVRAKNAVFFDQIGNRLLPPVGPPTGHSHHEESNRSDIHNRGSLHYRLHGAPESTSAENWDTTGKPHEGNGLESYSHRCRHRHRLVVRILPTRFLNPRLLVSKDISNAQRVAVSDVCRKEQRATTNDTAGGKQMPVGSVGDL
jgi:hypothetical protein